LDTMHDPDYLAECQKIHMPVQPVSGPRVQEVVAKLEGASPELIARAAKVIASPK
jgi:hypothetical protein